MNLPSEAVQTQPLRLHELLRRVRAIERRLGMHAAAEQGKRP